MSDAGLFELESGQYIRAQQRSSRDRGPARSGTHKMRERMEVFPLPDAPIRRT